MGASVTPLATARFSAVLALLCSCASPETALRSTGSQPNDTASSPLQASDREDDGPAATDLQPQQSRQRVLTDKTITAGDVATTPVDDLNLKDRKYPAILLDLEDDPYNQEGLQTGDASSYCDKVTAQIVALDEVLGEDLDLADKARRKITAGSVGREVVGMLIPFRGLIREASGANSERHRMAGLVMAGMMRRAYLKGLGQKAGCPYPASPADEETRSLLREFSPAQAEPARKRK